MDGQRRAVRLMQVYIREHINEKISLEDIAKAGSFSPWYARKLFINYLGISPAAYVRRLKLSNSALELRDKKCNILELAMSMGFGSVDGYQRAFRREFGCNPGEYADGPVPIWLFTPYLISDTERNVSIMSETRSVFIQVIRKPARKVLVKRGVMATDYWTYCNEVGCDVWGLLMSIKSISGEPVCLWLPEHLRKPVTNEYVQGVEVEADYSGTIPEGFDIIDLPEADYLLFRGEPFAEENFAEAIDEIWKAEKTYDPGFIGYEWDDKNPRIQLEPVGSRGYIELVPLKKIQ